ncbi:hypothetical protein C8R45DRAFT_1215007 [Mycena sanguinolenta]|nr:hypothetical protein C8R45DRAFT_1215007 [Mycena sanguinolenta]
MQLISSRTIALLALAATTAVRAAPAPTPVPAILGLTCIVDSEGFGLNLVNDGGSTTDKGGPPGEGTGVIVNNGPNSQINQEWSLIPQGSNFLIANGLNSSLFLSYPALPFGGGNPDLAGVVVYSRYPATFSFQTVSGGVRIVEVISGTALTSWSGPVTLARIGSVPANQQTWTIVAAPI